MRMQSLQAIRSHNVKKCSDFIFLFSVIFLFLIFAFNGVLTSYYIFHDDWTLFFLEKNNLIDTIKDHRYRAAHTEMGRPVGHAFFLLAHILLRNLMMQISLGFFTLFLMSCFGTLLFKLFNTLNYNKFFSILFICLFLITPPFYIISYQISGQYIVFSLIFSAIFMLLYKNYCYDNNNF